MLNWAVIREPFNWFVVAFALFLGAFLVTLVHPMTSPSNGQ